MTVARLPRRMWLLLDPYRAIVYVTPEARQALADTGSHFCVPLGYP